MTLAEITNEIESVAASARSLGASFKFVFKEGGVIHVDGNGEKAVICNDDLDADCALHMKLETYKKLKSGKINPTMALMLGKVKVKGYDDFSSSSGDVRSKNSQSIRLENSKEKK